MPETPDGGTTTLARRLRDGLLRRLVPRDAVATLHHAGEPPLVGLVESFKWSEVVGWVSGPADAFPIRVELYLNDRSVAATWAADPSPRNTYGQAREFRFALKDIWTFCRLDDRLSVRIAGRRLPISSRGEYRRPAEAGEYDPDVLAERMDEGYVFSQTGTLQLSKKLDVGWQRAVFDLYDRVARVLTATRGYTPFPIYGTLLGFAREQGFIGHDVDFDVAYVSRLTDPVEVAEEFSDIALDLVDAGFDVECRRTALHVHSEHDPDIRIDLFHLYFDVQDELSFPFGYAGRRRLGRDEWQGLTSVKLLGREVAMPVCAAALAETLYGDSWRTPIPGFSWERSRTDWDQTAWTSDAQREEVYWANFYAHHQRAGGSTFFEFVAARADLPSAVIDIGCGDGRDSFAFARHGRTVLGIDRSSAAVRHANTQAVQSGLASRLEFESVDVSDVAAVTSAVDRIRARADGGPVTFYLRFFLHSVPEETQEALLATLSRLARPGDAFAAEFRTTQDESVPKTYGGHFRRYQDGAQFGRDLRDRFGFAPVFETEGTGLAPYGDEDPVVYRVVAIAGGDA